MSTPPVDGHDVPAWPVIRITLGRDLRGGLPELTVGNEPVDVPTGGDPRTLAIAVVAQEAQRLGRPVRALAVDEDGSWPLIVHPDGATSDPPATSAPRRRPSMSTPPTLRARPARAPTGLVAGIAGLVLLLGLAAGAVAVTTTAARTPPATAAAPSTPAPDPLPPTTTAPPTSPTASPTPTVPARPTTTSPRAPAAAVPARPTRTAATTPPRSRASTRPAPPSRTRIPRSTAPALPVVGPLRNGLGRCLTGSPDGSAIWTATCEPGNPSQSWTTTADGTLRQGAKCVSAAATGPSVGIIPCTAGTATQRWTPASPPGHLINAAAALCLAELGDGTTAAVRCNPKSAAQTWTRRP